VLQSNHLGRLAAIIEFGPNVSDWPKGDRHSDREVSPQIVGLVWSYALSLWRETSFRFGLALLLCTALRPKEDGGAL